MSRAESRLARKPEIGDPAALSHLSPRPVVKFPRAPTTVVDRRDVRSSRRWLAICALVMVVGGCRTSQRAEVVTPEPPTVLPAEHAVVATPSAGLQPVQHTSAFHSDPARPSPIIPSPFRRDVDGLGTMLKDDALGVVEDPLNLALLGTSLGGAIAIRQDLDDVVRRDTENHPERWSDGSLIVGHLGEAPVQVPALLGVYWLSLETEDEKLHDFSRSVISAYTITGLSTLTIKGITDTDRPSPDWNGGRFGFPSFHAASTATIAGVVEEHYGTGVALPFYALAGAVAWTRIDERDHDLSDVVFGSAMGYVIGKSVARRHVEGNSRVRVAPWVHPSQNGTGLMWTVDF